MYNVTSWFQQQLELKASEPRRVFTIAGSDYSDYVLKWPTLGQKWNEVRAQNLTIDLANEDQSFDFIRSDKTTLRSACAVQFGFTHPTSGDELVTLFSGTMDKVRYQKGACALSLLDKFKQLSERVMGDRDTPATFTDSSTPPDIAWAAITSYGGYSAVESTSNPDIDYTSYLEWAAVFSADTVLMNAHVEGKKCSEVLKKISRYTQSAIYVQEDRIAFKRFGLADSASTGLDNSTIVDLTLAIDDEDIVNRQYVYGAYNVDSRDWGLQVFDVVTSSVNSYGPREQIEKDDTIWYVDSVSASTLAQKITSAAGEPYDRVTVQTTLFGALRQVGETITVVDSTQGIDAGFRVMEYTLNLDRGLYSAEIDRSQYLTPFTLDVSTLDGPDVLA